MNRFLSILTHILFWFLALSFLVSCGGDEPEPPTPPTPVTPVNPDPPTPAQDTKAPTITVSKASVNVIAGLSVSISGDELKIGDESVATWKDDVSTTLKTELTFTPALGYSKTINSGDKFSDEGKLQIKVTDEAGNSSAAEITLTRNDTKAPEITLTIQEKNVVAGVKVSVQDNQLLFDQSVAASRTDDYSTTFSIDLAFVSSDGQSKTINSGDILFDVGKLTLSVADEFQNKSTAEITLTSVAVYGLENLQGKTLQVDQEVDLLDGVTFAEGLTLGKFEVEENGVRTEMANPNAYTPLSAGTINIIITLERSDGSTIEVRVDGLTVKGIDYQAISLRNITPEEIFPQIAQIESGDKNIYSYVEDLRIAEAARIRDMMGIYGVGDYTPEQYQELMSRITMGLIEEMPPDYENHEWIGPWTDNVNVSDHWRITYQNLICLKSEYTDIKILSNLGEGWAYNLTEYAKSHPNRIILFSASFTPQYYTYPEYKQYVFEQEVIDLGNQPNVLAFFSGGDTQTINWVIIKKVYNGLYESNWDGMYNNASMANSDQYNYPDSNLRVVIGTNPQGDADMTNSMGSVFPIGFSDQAIVSGRPILPYYNKSGSLHGQTIPVNGSYTTSYPTPATASKAQVLFGLRADVKDANVLLEMMESATETDYISLNGMRQALPNYNPAKFYKKYCISVDIPASIQEADIIPLTKGWYKGLLFSIPGSEVLVNGEWISFEAKNKNLIISQNPMNLEWRLNGSLLRKYGYTSGQTIQGQIITVDDQWNGLRLDVPMTVQVR